MRVRTGSKPWAVFYGVACALNVVAAFVDFKSGRWVLGSLSAPFALWAAFAAYDLWSAP